MKTQWLIGFAIIVIGGAIQVWLLAFADLVLISTNMIVGVVFNTFLSIKFLGEKFLWKYDLPAISFMMIGAMIIVLLADTDEKMFTPDEMKSLLLSTQTLIYLLVGFVAIVAVNLYLHQFLKRVVRFEEDMQSWAKQQMRLEYIENPQTIEGDFTDRSQE